MIAKLTGRLDSSGAGHAVIDVGGVGYLVEASARTLDALGATGGEVTIHTEMLVGEDFLRRYAIWTSSGTSGSSSVADGMAWERVIFGRSLQLAVGDLHRQLRDRRFHQVGQRLGIHA